MYKIEHIDVNCSCNGKKCNTCKKILCIKHFGKRYSYRTLLNSDCIKCHKKNNKEYRQNNKEKCNLYSWRYQYHNLELFRIHNNNRRMLKNHANGMFTLQQWNDLKKFYNYTCLSCDKKEPEIQLTIDHIVPLTKNGSNDISNIQPLCSFCNSSKYDRIIDYRIKYKKVKE